ncbi:MAG: ATP-binding cassette domain-containing protein [bacterium]|nr:ATP-binding cassette domain-containing protein [bacterium]
MGSGLPTPLVEMRDISRSFGHIIALQNLDFTLYHGEVLALLGDNGAGKSTLIKILTGVYPPTSGHLLFDGNQVHLNSPQDARALGIETVYQDLALVPQLSIVRNFYLGREKTKKTGPFSFLDRTTMNAEATDALEAIGIHIRNPEEPVASLSGGERQSIAIGRAVHFGSRLLIMDEPTSALSIGETRKVLGYITAAKERALSVIFITHNIPHVFEVADRMTILHHGQKVGDYNREEVTPDEVAQMVMGGSPPDRFQNNPDL